jgi:hypothetical protein
MINQTLVRLSVAAIGALVTSGSAFAAPLAAPYGAGFVADAGGPSGFQVYGPSLGSVSGTGTNMFGSTFSDSASASLISGNPTVQVAGTAGAWAQAALVFQYQIVGPATASIPVVLTGTVSATSPGIVGAIADAQINPGNGFATTGPLLSVCSSPTPTCGVGTQQTSGSLFFSVPANTVQSVYMLAEIDAKLVSSGSFSAFADPSITIDPSFSHAGDYSIQFSPGVVVSVPEPETWATLLAGLGLVGLAGRRRRAPA